MGSEMCIRDSYMTGLIVDKAGFNAGFQFLSMIALVAFVLFALTFRESGRKFAAIAPVV